MSGVRAVVFDLWNTLADWPVDRWAEERPQVAARLGLSPEEFDERWYGELAQRREIGPMADALATFGAAVTKQGLVPGAGALDTIAELRARGLRVGLITICSDDVVGLWPETAFHGFFDAEVFSCSVGLRKPDPRIYLLACEQLGVQPQEALFVGDGANDELAGAERVGMTAVLLERPEYRIEWEGRRIRALPELLELV